MDVDHSDKLLPPNHAPRCGNRHRGSGDEVGQRKSLSYSQRSALAAATKLIPDYHLLKHPKEPLALDIEF
jgi:hypothetical protein